ncbi:hypothetical protein OAN22_02225 [Alphaproteobacteria bacterium]|nr:hypothetical protein [Alphaproteobacteria bacterium]
MLAKKNDVFLPVCLIGFLIHTYLLWPGALYIDAITALSIAQTGNHSTHIPPIFTYLWSFLWPHQLETAGMFVVQSMMLWGTFYFMGCAASEVSRRHKTESWLRFSYPLFALYPAVLLYSYYMSRDNHFLYALTLGISFLIFQHLREKPFRPWHIVSILVLFFYALSIKYQVRFVFPLLLFWLVAAALPAVFEKVHKILLVLGVCCIAYGATTASDAFSQRIAGQKSEFVSWQYIKMYELAGLSVRLDEFVLPDFLKAREDVTVDDLKERYDTDEVQFKNLWEYLVRVQGAPLRSPQNKEERDILVSVWEKEVGEHPWLYVAHRFKLFRGMFDASNVKFMIKEKLNIVVSHPIFDWLGYLFSYIMLLPFTIFLLWQGWQQRQTAAGHHCLMMSLLALGYFGVLGVKTLSGAPRYMYPPLFFTLLGMPLAFQLWFAKRRQKT